MKTNITALIFLVIIVLIGLIIVNRNKSEMPTDTTTPTQTTQEISITDQKITQENYSATKPVISGTGALADAARAFVDQNVATFGVTADKEVPDLRKEFGADAPTAHYELEMEADTVQSPTTMSIVINSYAYTGGANGMSSYKVFTASKKTGKVLALNDVIKQDQQGAFLNTVKQQLLSYRPDGGDTLPVFKEQVQKLGLAQLDDFAFNPTEMIIYFDKYEVGPGAMGPVPLPIPLTVLQNYLVPME
ncbi:MAG TPA: DUF3298 domain-containing protein [Candidatus Paceibacterota bacterium]